MNRLLLILLGLLALSVPAAAQTLVVPDCAATLLTYPVGSTGKAYSIDVGGRLCNDSGGTGTAAEQVQGNSASGAADVGNPVKVGGRFNTTPPTVANGQRVDFSTNSRGLQMVSAGIVAGNSAAADGISNNNQATFPDTNLNAATTVFLPTFNFLYNGATWDRARSQQGDGSTSGLQNIIAMGFNGASYDRPFVCNTTAVINVTAGATTELVALTASQIIRVCSFTVAMSAAGSAQFIYGTGTNCGTGPVNLTGAVPLATGTPWMLTGGAPGLNLFRTASANALCLAAVTGNAIGYVTYAKY